MSTSISSISEQLQTNVRYQRTPTTLTSDDYLNLAILGTKRFFIDIGEEDQWSDEFDGSSSITRTLNILEIQYCVLASEIEFLNSLLCEWNTLISYTTNALAVAHADKPYKAISEMIKTKKAELIELFNKMTDYSSVTDVESIDVRKVDITYE